MTRGSIVLALNLAQDGRVVPIAGGASVLLSSDGASRLEGTKLRLTADSCAVLEMER